MPLRRWRRRDAGLPGGRGIPPAPDHDAEAAAGEEAPPRRARGEGQRPPELVEITVGFDRFAAGALVARLEAEGVPVRLLTMDDHGLVPGIAARHPHRILVRAADEDRVREHIDRTR